MILILLNWYEALLLRMGGSDDLGPARVFRYITVRAGAALVMAFVVSLIFGPRLIEMLHALKAGQPIRKAKKADAISLHEMHAKKEGTPTMGGLLIMLATYSASLMFCDFSNGAFLLIALMSVGFGALGFWDDYAKVVKKNHLGVSARVKVAAQAVLGAALAAAMMFGPWTVTYQPTGGIGYGHLLVPLMKSVYPSLGLLFIPWAAFVMIGASNAVNLTDGLDGLAIGTTISSAFAFTVIAYLTSRVDMSTYLYLPHVPAADEMVVFGGALIGASLGFLWFNCHPAQVFMGDTGSMMLGGALGAMALLLKQELLLVLVGGVFVAEALSVIIQVASYKLTGKRVFRMSPLHHHYEKLGLHENKIILRFWTVGFLLALFGLATLKLR